MSLTFREETPVKALILLGILAPSLLQTKSESKESVATYNSQRVLRHLGMIRA